MKEVRVRVVSGESGGRTLAARKCMVGDGEEKRREERESEAASL